MRCPGRDTMYWKPGDIFEVDCPECGNKVEFFKDEARRRCAACTQTVLNPRMDFGCAAYCRYAAECLGELAPGLAGQRDELLKERVAVEVKRRLGGDFRRIAHGVKVARFVESIGTEEKVALGPALCAAFLHLFWEGGGELTPDAGALREQDARALLDGLGARADLVDRTLELVRALVTGSTDDSPEGMVFFDAHLLAATEEPRETVPGPGQPASHRGALRTAAGRRLAQM